MKYIVVFFIVSSIFSPSLARKHWASPVFDIYTSKAGYNGALDGKILADSFKELLEQYPVPNNDCVKQKYNFWLEKFNEFDLFSNMTVDDLKQGLDYECGSPENFINYDGSMAECVIGEGGSVAGCHKFITTGGMLDKTTYQCFGMADPQNGDFRPDAQEFYYQRYREDMNCPPCPKLFKLDTFEHKIPFLLEEGIAKNIVQEYKDKKNDFKPDEICFF